jgi:DNA-binding NarL/FixJ family response regulator
MPVTLLIIDDNALFRALIREIVTEESDIHVVGEAGDGAEAMRLALELRPDIMVLDLVMPGISGFEVLRWIKVEHPEIRVIVVTVHDDDAYRQAAADSSADAFLLKKSLGTCLLPTIQRLRNSLPSAC